MISSDDYETLAKFAFSSSNPGYKPEVIEAPNGDGVWDDKKKYAHLSPKYFKDTDEFKEIKKLYNLFKLEAAALCESLGIPKEFYPGDDSTIRVLNYPPGATTAPHTDFDLLTTSLYRKDRKAFKYLDGEDDPLLVKARELSPGIHLGELMTEVNGAVATKHEVLGTEEVQKSAVFFVVPDHAAVLPSGLTVGQWMEERKARSRKTHAA